MRAWTLDFFKWWVHHAPQLQLQQSIAILVRRAGAVIAITHLRWRRHWTAASTRKIKTKKKKREILWKSRCCSHRPASNESNMQRAIFFFSNFFVRTILAGKFRLPVTDVAVALADDAKRLFEMTRSWSTRSFIDRKPTQRRAFPASSEFSLAASDDPPAMTLGESRSVALRRPLWADETVERRPNHLSR